MSAPSDFKILGQEPAFFVGVVEAVLVGLLSFGIFDLSQDTIGVILAAVSATLGLVVAYATKTTLYSALIGFAKAILVLAVTFGAPLTDAQTSSVIALIALVAGGYLREKTFAVDTAVSTASPGANVVPIPVTDVGPANLAA
jgi:uncharacterized membrane protein